MGLAATARPELMVPWASSALAGAAIGWFTAPKAVRGDRERRRIYVPGSTVPLVASIVVFLVKYGCGIALATHPDARQVISLVDMSASGASAGFFASGWLRTMRRSRIVPREDLTGAATAVE